MSRYHFTINGTLNGLNDYIRAERTQVGKGRSFLTKGALLKKDQQHKVAMCIRRDLKRLHIDCPVTLNYMFYEPNKKRDHDNVASFCMKVTQDALVECKVIDNDGWRNIIAFHCDFDVDKKNPRIEVEIVAHDECEAIDELPF